MSHRPPRACARRKQKYAMQSASNTHRCCCAHRADWATHRSHRGGVCVCVYSSPHLLPRQLLFYLHTSRRLRTRRAVGRAHRVHTCRATAAHRQKTRTAVISLLRLSASSGNGVCSHRRDSDSESSRLAPRPGTALGARPPHKCNQSAGTIHRPPESTVPRCCTETSKRGPESLGALARHARPLSVFCLFVISWQYRPLAKGCHPIVLKLRAHQPRRTVKR